MWWVYYKLHALIIGGVRGLAALLARSVGRFLLAVWMLLHEEVRRYIGLTVWGVVLVLFGKATLNYIPADVRTPLLLVNLGLLGIWAMAVKRAAKITRHNSLEKQHRKKAMRDLADDVKGTRRDVGDWLARRTRNMPAGRAFKSNRDKIAAAEEQARQAEAEAAEQARHEAYLESLPPDHDPFAKIGS